MDKKPNKAQSSVDRAPAPSRWRARALISLIWKFPLVAHPRDPDGALVPPHFVTPKTKTSRARAMEVARPRNGGRTHLNEGYFWDFTFPGQRPSISQAQFDLYGGGTAEAQHTFSHFINFSLRIPPKRNLCYIRYQLAVWQTNPQFWVQLTFGAGVAWRSCLSSRLLRVTRCHRYNPAVTRTSCTLAKYGASNLCPELTNSIGSPLSPGRTCCHQVPKHLCHAAVANHVRSRNCHYASRGVGHIALQD
ncbi:hypothetical protein PIB30_031012 [Stylosanthes scabra]|uniref:Uncharacterized protein n=1 Tax=Stylosanthes scabra TaxID=79078 RepID=A0ABU6WDT9_9FABA|nr:hypothetical protein [Stylosanthes scabra]